MSDFSNLQMMVLNGAFGFLAVAIGLTFALFIASMIAERFQLRAISRRQVGLPANESVPHIPFPPSNDSL